MEIRRLSMVDYEEMTKLWSRANLPFKPKVRDSREAIAEQMKANPDFCLGAFAENRLVGVVLISSDKRKGWINRLAVDPEYRHYGIAEALISESENVLREKGIRIFCALIERNNTASQRLFKKCGYVGNHDVVYFSKRDSVEV